jgi:hypothetical protein
MTSFVERESQSSNVQWGRMVAGATVATGVVMVGLAIGSGEVPILSDIADGVKQLALIAMDSAKELISGLTTAAPPSPTEVAGTGVFAKFGEYLADIGTFLQNNAKFLGGAALLGAGAGYMSTHPSPDATKAAPAMALASNARLQTAQMGFAAREQMRAVNALMEARMQAFGGTPTQDGSQAR